MLREQVQAIRVAKLPELPPFTGGAVGYAGYDTVRYVEHLPNAPPDDRQLPDLSFAFYDHMVVFDNVQKTIVVVAMARLDKPARDPAAAYADACRRVDRAGRRSFDAAGATLRAGRHRHRRRRRRSPIESNFTQARVRGGGAEVRRVHPRRRHLSGRHQPAAGSAARGRSVRDLSHAAGGEPQPVHVLSCARRACTLVGSSPEIMVRVVDGKVTVRPLAGTRRRGATEEEDQRLAEELLADPEGAGRARDARRPGPQRRRPRGRSTARSSSPT